MQTLLRAGILITLGILVICIASSCGDDPPEEATDPPQPEEDVGPPRATRVEVNPAPRDGPIPIITIFTLTFNQEVVAVWLNDTATVGSGRVWQGSPPLGSPPLSEGSRQSLTIKWVNLDRSTDTKRVGPYEVLPDDGDPPTLTSGTVADGAVNVNPAPINRSRLRFHFDEDVTGTIKLTDEVGVDLNWVGIVQGDRATLTPVAGQELVHGTTYKIEIDVKDGAGDRLQETITFVTKPK